MADGSSDEAERGARAAAGGRFQLRRRLGSGASGEVYEAYDHVRSGVVAIKILSRVDPTSLLRFKSEFRMLANLSHPNLLAIHELVAGDGDWCLVMELVEGGDLRCFLGLDAGVHQAETEDLDATGAGGHASRRAARVDLRALRDVLRQLATAIDALHAAGRLHLDLKPTNVLVDRAGRVVICDFGLSVIIGQDHRVRAGTLPYVAPEQAAGEPVSEASDWYSVGVILYEALAGRLPYEGNATEVLAAKSLGPPQPPSRLVEGVPPDLESLCLALLAPKPDDRPSGFDVLRRLGVRGDRKQVFAEPAAVLFGRQRELAVLRQALARARDRSVLVHVTGESGVGKSALVHHFLGELPGDVVALTGRCHERESVPFKLLDGVIDELGRYLMALPAELRRRMLPSRIADLSRVFPVLRRIEAATGGATIADGVRDPQEAQHRASLAWRQLVHRLATTRPLVIAIDDVQWGDLDSVGLLADVLDVAPSVLVVVGYRDPGDSEHAVIAAVRALDRGAAAEVLALQPLPLDAAESLARVVMGSAPGDPVRVAREARGNPFLIAELAHHVASTNDPARVDLADAVSLRAAQLPVGARRLLEVVAVAARPLQLALAIDAAGTESRDPRAWSALRAGRFVRLTGVRETDHVECYHDAVRQAVVRRLDAAALQQTHLRLAHVLETIDAGDPETIAEHYLGAGESQRAAHYTERAAEQAIAALAFERAVRLFEAALALPTSGRGHLLRLRIGLGEALASAGRGRDAAQAFLEAAELAGDVDALEMRRRAAEHFLRSGHVDEGLAAIGKVLAAVGLRLAPTPPRAVASLALRRVLVRVRGTRFRARAPSALSRQELSRVDTCWSVALGLGLIDSIRGADFQARHLLAALGTGEPYRVARALCLETAYTAGGGGRTLERTRRLAAEARAVAERTGVPHAIGLASGVSALACFLRGEWRAAVDEYRRAEQIFREQCAGAAWELASVHLFTLASWFYLGELRELATATPLLLREAETRGDLYAATSLRSSRSNVAWLVRGQPELAREQLELTARTWTRRGFHLQHFYEFLGHAQIDLYLGDGAAAWRRVREIETTLRRSFLLRVQTIAIESFAIEGRAALAAWRLDRDSAKLAVAARCARSIDREAMAWSTPLASLLRAGVLAARDDLDAARSEAMQAAVAARAAGMRLHAAVAEAIAEAVAERRPWRAAALLAEEGVADPERLCAMLAPGPWQAA